VRGTSQRRTGFTLVELIVVIVILGILLAIAIPALTGYIAKAQDEQYIAEARDIVQATRSVLDEAYAAGKFSSGDAAGYFTTGWAPGMTDITAFVVKRFSLADLSTLATGYSRTFMNDVIGLGATNMRFHVHFVAPLGSDVTALTADAFMVYPEGRKPGDPTVVVTYGLSRVGGLVYTQDLHDAIKIDGTSTLDPNAGYVVYHLMSS
jgi:prepilin-type N-terminal cleavage/methylation domain-containing protein